MSEELAMAIVELKRDEVLDMVNTRIGQKESPLQILEECRQGMTLVGERFQKGEYFLAQLILSAELFKEVVEILDPYLTTMGPQESKGKVVVATLAGDIHDLGKNIFTALVKAQGFEVHDLGVDVAPAILVEKVREVKPDFVGFSVLITSVFDAIKEAADMLEEIGLRNQFKLLVGGGIASEMVRDYIGADFYTTDAMEGVVYCIDSIGGKR